ncbi:MAG TPA: carboxypeptidase-like regulatory domain-containing protein [Vicinamibacterales bacterium]|nr:carboxypeptidase-like regulatory domain-containing protein [Vicinamibacterales bacterium]
MRRTLFVGLTSLLLCTPCVAQTLGTISGEVRDATGAVIPGVTVTVVNKATNATRTATSNAVGLFDFPALPPGPYTVKTELEGFKTSTRDLELEVQQTARVDFTLELGTVSEMTTVAGVAPLVETQNATIGTVIENKRIVELPLNGRNYLDLVKLSPNVSAEFAGAGQAGSRQGGTRANQELSISGQRREFNYFTLDGVSNTDVNFNTYIFLPSVDALEEFKVQTGVYSAEFGREASQVNVVTKSGTNSLHGTVFEFLRDDKFDARPYSFRASQAAAPKPPFHWNQYGYTAGGPVLRNRLFFMSNFEGYKDRKQFQTLYSVPSAAMRTGNFSELLANVGPSTAINPQTGQLFNVIVDPTQCAVAGQARTCAPFSGNIIPTGRLNGIAKQLLEFYPVPNSGAGGLTNNYLALQDRVIDKNQFTQRVDFLQSASSSWMGRYSYGNESEVMPALKLNGTKLRTSVNQAVLGNTWTVSSTLLNEFRFGYNYLYNTFGRELAFVRDVVSELKIPGLSPAPPEAWGIPSIPITGFSGFGDDTEGPYTIGDHVFELNDNVSWIRGRHAFKIGGGIRYDMYNQVGNQFARGNFQFQPIATGYAFADFMLGYTQQDEAAVALATTKFRALSQAYYFTDTWKIQSKMTLDLGLRYEYTPPWFDANGTLMNASLPCHNTTPNVQDLSCHPVLVRIGSGDVYEGTLLRFAPNIQIARDGRLGDRLIFDDKTNFAPRIGWAWSPSEKWSYRAGVGVFYVQDTGNPRFDMARNLSGRRRDNTLLLTPDLTLNAPFRGVGSANDCGVAPPLVCLTNVYVLGNMPDRKTPYMVQYLFNVQRELNSSTALEIGYLGSHSYRLERMFDWNETIPGVTGSVQSRKPYPEFTKVQEIGNVAQARYNSLAIKVTRRLHDGLSVLGAYTLSKSEDNGSGIRTLTGDTLFPQNSFCLDCEWGLSVFDVRHRFVASILYELPFGGGKSFMQNGAGAAILGGWQISTIISKSSGFPRTAYVGTDRSNTAGGQDRPNVTGPDPNLAGDQQTIQQWFNTGAFALNTVGTFGNAGRNTIIGPGITRVDASIMRNFRLTTNKTLQFRLEGFNLLNTPIWGDPNTTLTSPLYGTINTTRTPMRELQIGVKFVF